AGPGTRAYPAAPAADRVRWRPRPPLRPATSLAAAPRSPRMPAHPAGPVRADAGCRAWGATRERGTGASSDITTVGAALAPRFSVPAERVAAPVPLLQALQARGHLLERHSAPGPQFLGEQRHPQFLEVPAQRLPLGIDQFAGLGRRGQRVVERLELEHPRLVAHRVA